MKAIKLILVLATVFSTLTIAAPAQAATGTIGPWRAAKIACGTFPGRHIQVTNPSMYAVNSTSSVDAQWVAYKPIVFRWNGSSWVEYTSDTWMRGRATDSASPSTWIDPYSTPYTAPANRTMNVAAGYYKVAIRYHWYATNHVGSGSEYRWAPQYTNPDGTVSTNYCTVR